MELSDHFLETTRVCILLKIILASNCLIILMSNNKIHLSLSCFLLPMDVLKTALLDYIDYIDKYGVRTIFDVIM